MSAAAALDWTTLAPARGRWKRPRLRLWLGTTLSPAVEGDDDSVCVAASGHDGGTAPCGEERSEESGGGRGRRRWRGVDLWRRGCRSVAWRRVRRSIFLHAAQMDTGGAEVRDRRPAAGGGGRARARSDRCGRRELRDLRPASWVGTGESICAILMGWREVRDF